MDKAKQKIRKYLKEEKFNMSDIEKSFADSAIYETLNGLLDIKNAQTIAVFAAVENEVDLSSLMVWIIKHKKSLCLPRSKQKATGVPEYEMAEITSMSDLEKGSYGISEPSSECPCCGIDKINIWLVPGTAFAGDGTRLGRGGGVYDRLLKKAVGKKIGVLYQYQLFDSLPSEAHDIKMDMLITEQQVITIE